MIILVWGNGARAPFYTNASSNIRVVGKELSLIVKGIKTVFYADYSTNNQLNVHCFVHSLGAHLCGYAGYFSRQNNSIYFDRISGMDAAGPLFEGTDILVRLDSTDANYVDAYHTNAGILLNIKYIYKLNKNLLNLLNIF